MAEVILFGEPMAMFVAMTEEPLSEVTDFTRMLAGAEVNVAIGLRRLGHSAAYVTKLGRDPFGEYIEGKLNSEGIETQIAYDSEHFTGFQLKSKVSKGDSEVFYFRKNSAASFMTEADIEKLDMTGAKLLHITGIPPALSRDCRNATYRLIERAKDEGMYITFDPNLRPSLWESRTTMIRTINHLSSMADIVLPGTGEGKMLMGSGEPAEIAAFYRNLGAKAVIVKDGANGAYIDTDGIRESFPGYPVEKVVDTVGAGDGFAVGIISAILEELSIEEMISRGNAIGSMQVSVKGDNEGLPTREKLEAFLLHRN